MTGFCRFFTIAFSIQLSKSSRLFAASLPHYWEGDYTLSWPHGPGGDERIRTADPLLAKQVLSQLSYIPTGRALSAVHPGLGAHRSFGWWAFLASNQGPHAYQACALTS